MGKTVLTVDDSASIRAMVSITLKGAGYEVIEAVDGEDGLERAQTAAPALVITDQNMPKMDGITLTRKLRQMDQFRTTPILMLTTESGDAIKAEGRAAGLTGWMVKPFDPQTLLMVIRKVIG